MFLGFGSVFLWGGGDLLVVCSMNIQATNDKTNHFNIRPTAKLLKLLYKTCLNTP